jgi:hypothetical protein
VVFFRWENDFISRQRSIWALFMIVKSISLGLWHPKRGTLHCWWVIVGRKFRQELCIRVSWLFLWLCLQELPAESFTQAVLLMYIECAELYQSCCDSTIPSQVKQMCFRRRAWWKITFGQHG